MISIDTIRSAVLSDQPWARLDEIVRAELAAGRTTRKIFDELWSISNEVQDTPGLSEDGEDALGDTLDALNGFCSSRDAYKNPPILPSEDEIAELPRWARVAFAARCARRVLPLYIHSWPDGKSPYQVELQSIVDLEQLAGTTNPNAQYPRNRICHGTIFAGMPEVAAQIASLLGDLILPILTPISQVKSFHGSMEKAAAASRGIEDVTPFIRRDFDHIEKYADWHRWTDETPVPPEVFGPLWPEGPPKGWPADPDVLQRADLPLELLSRAKVLEQMTEDETVNLFNQINAYYIARTGTRLTMEDLLPMIAAGVLAEV